MYESQQKNVLNIFSILVKNGYSQRLDLLYLFMDSQAVNTEMMEELLKIARLNVSEKQLVFERYAEKLLSLSPKSLLPYVEEMVEQYIEQFTWDKLLNARSKRVLGLLKQQKEFLSPELEQKVSNWNYAGEAIRFGEREQLSYTYGKAYLNEMGNALVQLHLTNDNQYMRWFYSTVYITIRLEPTNKEQLLDETPQGSPNSDERAFEA